MRTPEQELEAQLIGGVAKIAMDVCLKSVIERTLEVPEVKAELERAAAEMAPLLIDALRKFKFPTGTIQ